MKKSEAEKMVPRKHPGEQAMKSEGGKMAPRTCPGEREEDFECAGRKTRPYAEVQWEPVIVESKTPVEAVAGRLEERQSVGQVVGREPVAAGSPAGMQERCMSAANDTRCLVQQVGRTGEQPRSWSSFEAGAGACRAWPRSWWACCEGQLGGDER